MSLETKQVELKSVGLVLTLSQSNWRLSSRKNKLQQDARDWQEALIKKGKIPDSDELVMRELFYPVLAGCVVSDTIPSVEDCLDKILESELDEWYETAKQLNPGWFTMLDKIAELSTQAEEEKADAALKKGMTNSETTQGEQMPTSLLTG